MKRFLSLILCIVLLVALSAPVFASESPTVLSAQKAYLDNGITITEEVLVLHPQARTNERTAVKRLTIDEDGVVIAKIAFQATFRYDYTTVWVYSKSILQTDTFEGWNYKQTSFTSSGGTVNLTGKITKLLVLKLPFDLTLTCDAYGNIS